VLKRLSKFDVVIIDDIGDVQQSRDEMEVLFTLLAERYERGSVMLTSNLPFSQWIIKSPLDGPSADMAVRHPRRWLGGALATRFYSLRPSSESLARSSFFASVSKSTFGAARAGWSASK